MSEWYVCLDCQTIFQKYKYGNLITRCPNCKSRKLGELGTKFYPTKDFWMNPSEREEC